MTISATSAVKPSELWTLFDDHYYGTIKGHLYALHKNPTGARGGERNHKAAKRIHSRSRARLGKHKIKTRTTIMFNSKQLGRQIATTRDAKFCKWLQQRCLDNGYEAELKEDPLTRMRMVVVVALMNLIALTYPRVSTTCMTRISLRPRRWWTRVTSTKEVVCVLYNTFGIIWYYTVLYNAVREDSNYTYP